MTFYPNGVTVSFNKNVFLVVFSFSLSEKRIYVAMPPDVAKALAKIISEQLTEYEKLYGRVELEERKETRTNPQGQYVR